MFLLFNESVEAFLPPARFTYPFNYIAHPLAVRAKDELTSYINSQSLWREELRRGKMFGVLIVKNKIGELGYLAAFSGNIAGQNNHLYFVPPIYDMLKPKEFFRVGELEITNINLQVSALEQNDNYIAVKANIENLKSESAAAISNFKSQMKIAKEQRAKEREAVSDNSRVEELLRESQFQKAELKRLEKRFKCEMKELEEKLVRFNEELGRLKLERKSKSALLQNRLFEEFKVLGAKGERLDLLSIFKTTSTKTPPAGAGECAAPKMLQYAFVSGLTPICMAEFWWGESPKGELRKHGNFYPSCVGKCKPILEFMLDGIDVDNDPLMVKGEFEKVKVVYEDDWLLVVDKPAGVLSVPGKVVVSSLYSYLKETHLHGQEPYMVHRLDMATSGLLIVAKSVEVQAKLQRQFENREVKKCYVAILNGCVVGDIGVISLPLAADYNDRPRQRVDYDGGKESVTQYEVVSRTQEATRVKLYPLTGRTHQLRLHCAHNLGLNAPIIGDTLYGESVKYGKRVERLHLHAANIEFYHPIKKTIVSFSSEADF